MCVLALGLIGLAAVGHADRNAGQTGNLEASKTTREDELMEA